MSRIRIFLPLLIIAAPFFGAVQPAGAVEDIDRLLVVNGLSETLTLIDRAGDSVAQNVIALGLAPNRIRRAGSSVLLVNSISDDLWVIDPLTFAVTRTVKFPDGDNPWDVVVIDDSLCAVSMLVASNAILVNYATGDTLSRIATGKSPEGMLVADSNLWIANTGFDFGTFQYDPGTVTIANAYTGAPVTTVPVGTNPQSIVRVGDGTLHVLCTGNYFDRFGIVYVIDPETAAVLDSIPLGGSPGDLVVGPGGINYIAAGGWVDSGEVYRYDALSRTVLNGAANPWHSAQGVTGLIDRAGGGIYTLCFNADSVIGHAPDGTVMEKYQVGDGPQAAVYITNRQPGDLDEDGFVTALDLGRLIDYLFAGAPPPPRPASADLNADCFCDALDLGELIDYLFAGSVDVQWGCAR
jgi:YVTN family beta-propeller protein